MNAAARRWRAAGVALCASIALGCQSRVRDTGPAAAAPPDARSVGEPASTTAASTRCASSALGPRMLRRLTRVQLENTLRGVFPGVEMRWTGFQLPDLASPLGFSNDGAVLVVSEQTERAYLESVESLAALASRAEQLAVVLPCARSAVAAAAGEAAACGDALIAYYGPRLFRRALIEEELLRYEMLFRSVLGSGGFEAAAKWTLVALMQSPHMMYRRELGVPKDGRYRLTGNELAAELAYTFANSAPSPDLIERAERGELDAPEARIAEARTLLASESGRRGLQRFFEEWLRYPSVATADRPAIAGFADVRARMLDEMASFLDAVVYEGDGDLHALLTAPYTFVDPQLARYYGWPAPSGAERTRVERPAMQGIGLLAQGALLASSANQDASSPTRRGLLVLERLLCRPRPTPPANVPPLGSADASTARTTRERYEKLHAGREPCASCHAQFDPLGFAFEHFDQGGRYRDTEAGATIDSGGELRGLDGRTLSFLGQDDFARGLADSQEVADCVSGLLAAYAFGGGGGATCLAEDARANFDGRTSLVEYLAQLSAEPHFEARADEVDTPATAPARAATAAAAGRGADPLPVGPSASTAAGANGSAAGGAEQAGRGGTGAGADAGAAPPPPTPPDDAVLRAQYATSNTSTSDNIIAPTLQLVHAAGTQAVSLASIELRYYFTNEHPTSCPDDCRVESYYAGLHPSGKSVNARRSYVASEADNAYLSITFDSSAGELRPGESVELQQQFHTDPYRDFDESNDYSFDATKTTLTDHARVTVYRDGNLIWGTPP